MNLSPVATILGYLCPCYLLIITSTWKPLDLTLLEVNLKLPAEGVKPDIHPRLPQAFPYLSFVPAFGKILHWDLGWQAKPEMKGSHQGCMTWLSKGEMKELSYLGPSLLTLRCPVM